MATDISNHGAQDLKDRYYDVNRKLLKARSPTPGDISQERAALINQYTYDKGLLSRMLFCSFPPL